MRLIERRSVPCAALLLVLVAVAGCGGGSGVPGTAGRATAPAATEDDRGAAGAPVDPGSDGSGDGGGGGAKGAPITIPARTDNQGLPLDVIGPIIENGIRDQCGGDLCVDLSTEHRDEGFCTDQFVVTEPAQGTTVDRGTTVVIVAGSKSCDDEGGTGEGETGETGEGEGEGEGETGETEPTDAVTP